MSVRSFTVFQDTPTEIQKITHVSDKNLVITTAADAAATLLSTLAAIEKENLHPLTGERAAQATANASKKRKTAVLVTKVVAPPLSSKKQKEVKSEPKKSRKSSSGKKSDGRKKIPRGSRPQRNASPLPRVDEEQELSTATPMKRDPTRLIISQANIDSKCYELTVSPLADVSEAYDTATETSDQESVFDKEQSVEPEIRDYFSPPLSHASLPSEQAEATPLASRTASHTEFSTPERKQIYSAFTFSSPSPSSKRFKEAQSSPQNKTNASHSE
ncbi:hypothetical protein DEU56DRAFT_917022 [Suillus clintonianus]|uniref:uncharacterized protein n=1 Tax=Suillus clintonianus TaxID=1904413 RepID=UPI001B86B557|nr:uncharacterized protein DEU56DRAFT_917022 [Suillus clintonianus]KAG2124443.1 hypothetical protein DEU56DRAFT_917022 [Suillus clintonianus]